MWMSSCNNYMIDWNQQELPTEEETSDPSGLELIENLMQHTAAHCSKLQHTAARCSTLQQTATDCHRLQLTATHCKVLQRTATHFNTLLPITGVTSNPLGFEQIENSMRHTVTHCQTLHHTATHCSTLRPTIHVTSDPFYIYVRMYVCVCARVCINFTSIRQELDPK